MKIAFYIVRESFRQAWNQLVSNKLRSFLSLLGILIGVLCIVLILSAVDSLEANINESFDKLGKDVVYVDKMPWDENPDENYWKYAKRPNADYADYEAIKRRVHTSDLASLAVFMPTKLIKYRSNSIRGAYMVGVTYDYDRIFKLEYEDGRFFTPFEYETGADRAVLGYEIAKNLFEDISPVGKQITIYGKKVTVIGVMKKEGKSLINVIPFDRAIIIGYNQARSLVNVDGDYTWGTLMNVKAAPGVTLEDLKDEVTGVLRAHRRLKPLENDNFAINQVSTFTNLLKPIFSVLSMVGGAIAFFAILVGMFSVANIMFVSVKERTNQIGVKKALGATQNTILIEFLIESVVLCVIGGLIGLMMVFGIAELATSLSGFNFFLPLKNILLGITLSILIGVIAGIIPAWQAARLDPVEAIRQ